MTYTIHMHHTISFQNAFRGIWTAIITQTNIRIHFIIGSFVLSAAVYFHLTFDKLIDLIIAISLVMTAEMVNTAIEFISDAVTFEYDENIKRAKDIAAGAVLMSAIFAVFIGLMIFLPEIL
ncbi:diacylglycerol kinase [Candidatus Collierbacteria bacterium CG10_big_fil_rev_8_21_14_0_10_44_9]|uniref:Diacylglycerol kinase n=1 Tax=Candidatus Collierbacteria bacterium CG10_big_fil_rev_8_21_14_0_10_44_9 TaxID=1974535 RepID=A0A2H0VI35_9BACT|nr:MAG: diacylglycerol kinase [Candidatus Collierbacteria bacterium CG10_big_fil_rev_8_21_14_0_10_44_9]